MGILGFAQKIQVCVPYKMISSSQSIYEVRQSSRRCSTLSPCLGCYDEFPMVSIEYSYTLDMNYGESWHKVIELSWFTKLLYYWN